MKHLDGLSASTPNQPQPDAGAGLTAMVERMGALLMEAAAALQSEAQYHAGIGNPKRCEPLQEVGRKCARAGLSVVLHKDHLKFATPAPQSAPQAAEAAPQSYIMEILHLANVTLEALNPACQVALDIREAKNRLELHALTPTTQGGGMGADTERLDFLGELICREYAITLHRESAILTRLFAGGPQIATGSSIRAAIDAVRSTGGPSHE